MIKIASTAMFILQQYDKEWDSYIDLDEEDALQDHDKLRVAIMSECTQAARESLVFEAKVCTNEYPLLL